MASTTTLPHDEHTPPSHEKDEQNVLFLELWNEPVAQSVEHRPFKALVLGSSPSGLTIPPHLPCPHFSRKSACLVPA
jgi:hypothetical protein